MRPISWGTATLSLLVVACTLGGQPTTTTAPPETTTAPTTTAAEQDDGGPVCRRGPRPFYQEGPAGTVVSERSDAAVLSDVSWDVHPSCERLTIGFSTAEGAPALDPPSIIATLMRDVGILRLELGDPVSGTGIAEQLVDTDLVERFFVVRGLDGALFVDLHLADAAFARVEASASPARVVVDLRSGGPRYPATPRRVGDLIVVRPTGSEVTFPIAVVGYARTGQRSLEAALVGPDRTVVAASTETAPQGDAWGAFLIMFADGPAGSLTLEVGGAIEIPLQAEDTEDLSG